MAQEYKRIAQLGASSAPEDRAEAQRLIRNPPAALAEEARRLGDEFSRSGRVGYLPVMTMLGLESVPRDPALPDSHFMLSWLSWFRYGKPIQQLMEERKTDWKAARQLLSVQRDYEKWRFGRLDPEKLQFKTDRQHYVLMAAGLNSGIDALSSEELADCLDALCPCGGRHSPENLRKLRTRLIKGIRTFNTASS